MTKNKLEKLAAEHIATNYAPVGTCSALAVKQSAIVSELGERTRLVATGDCKNKFFSKNDCKREQEVFIPALQEASRQIAAAQKASKCGTTKDGSTTMSLPTKLGEDIATAAIEATNVAAEQEESKTMRNYLMIGGVAVAAIVAVLILKRKA
jgi:hypothetical protein